MSMQSQTEWAARAQKILPAGGFGNFDPNIVIREGKGARIWDEDGNEYVDLLIGSGPILIGHGHPEVLEATQEQLGKGMTFFANNARGIELAEVICDAVACADQVRFVSTGGEADMYAMRLARAHTGRDKILKFEGGYHGMSAEALMSLFPQSAANYPVALPDSAGIPESVRDHMVIAPFNDTEMALGLIEQYKNELAAVILEPLQRQIPPAPGFLEALREATARHGIVLVFDEVVTGFRLAYGGAQEKYGVVPDLCTLGKVIGGGLPLAAIAGSRDVMRHFDRDAVGSSGFTLQIGTLSGNPVASVAGLKTLEILRRPGTYETMRASGQKIMSAISSAMTAAGLPHQIVGDPTLFDVFFTERPIRNYRDIIGADAKKGTLYNKTLMDNGVFKSPGKTYISTALTDDDIAQVEGSIQIAAQALAESSPR